MKIRNTILVLSLSIGMAKAQDIITKKNINSSANEYTESNLDGLCAAISSHREESENSEQTYVYQTKILAASGVKMGDSKDEIKRKVQIFWKKNEKKLTCDSPDFNVPNGSIIKFAIARRFEDFIDDVTETWGIDLNMVDTSDNRTVLDYVKNEQEKYKHTPIETILRRYYKKLRDAGAKHKNEL